MLRKTLGFCCDEKNQGLESRYNMRNSSFASSLTDVNLNGGGPSMKFRLHDINQSQFPIQRGKIMRVKGMAHLGHCKRSRGPLQWYLEDEIMFARDILTKERQNKYNMNLQMNLKIAKLKARKRRNRLKKCAKEWD